MKAKLYNLTTDDQAFIQQWLSPSATITAHTSGSTGEPKLIELSKADMAASARSTCQYFDITADSMLICPLSVSYIAGKMMIIRALEANCSLWLETPSNTPLQTAPPAPGDLISLVPSQIPHLLESPDKLKHIRRMLVGGAPISPALEASIRQSGVEAYASYGMTETASHVALRRIGAEDVYHAMPDITFTTDSRSCLIITSSSRSFGSLVTNDVVELIDNSQFRWLGRYDNVINSGGIKVYPERIEELIRSSMPHGLQYYITAAPDNTWGETPVLVVERGAQTAPTPDAEELLAIARQHTHGAERPTAVIFTEQIRSTSSGKIIRSRVFSQK